MADGTISILLLGAFVTYAIMGGITLFEKIAGGTDTYFRAITSILSIRDLRTALQFDWTKTVLSIDEKDPAALKKARTDLVSSAETFATEVDKITKAEVGQWQAGFTAAMTAAGTMATKGLDDVKSSLDDLAKRQDAAAKAVADAAKLATVNVKIEGDFDGEARILVDNVERVRTHLKSYPVDAIQQGIRKIEIFATRGGKAVAAAAAVDCKAGLQDVTLTLA
jgi:hypothetical protein